MDCARNIITANFSGGTSATTAPLWQWDYGQALCITGIDLPAAFEVHFSTNRTGGVSTVAVGADGQVTIPNDLLTIGKNLNAWIYLSDSEGEGETEYAITIPVKARPMPETYDAEATGEFDDVVRQVSEYAQTAQTAADNAGASASAAATSASEAAASASAAESAKTAAETAQGKAEDAQAAAETAAQTATQKAQQTAQDAAQAAQSKADAESAAGRAEAAETGAQSAKMDAETAAQGAAASASAASASATSAGQAATSAGQSATAAAGSATTAQNAAQTATTKAGEAFASADAAAASETAAQTAQQGAETAETNAGQSASTATTKAAEAAQSASNAAASETAAEAAATRAETAAASLTVDSALSDSSVNPVENRIITAEVTQVKSAISQIEDDVYTVSDNLFDFDSVIDNKVPGSVGSSPDTMVTLNNWHTSNYIPVVAGEKYALILNGSITTGAVFRVACYSGGVMTYRTTGGTEPNPYTIPDGVDHIRFYSNTASLFSARTNTSFKKYSADMSKAWTPYGTTKNFVEKGALPEYGVYVDGSNYYHFVNFGNVTLIRLFKQEGPNNLFQYSATYIGEISKYGASIKETIATNGTDTVGPISIMRQGTDSGGMWAGGWHTRTVDGTAYPTARQASLDVRVNGTSVVGSNGIHYGEVVATVVNQIYFPQTITGADLSTATQAIEETVQYILNAKMTARVWHRYVADTRVILYYGMQAVRIGFDSVMLPNNESEITFSDMTENVKLDKAEDMMALRKSGWNYDLTIKDFGLAKYTHNPGTGANKYGSIPKDTRKIYWVLIEGTYNYSFIPTGKVLAWEGEYNIYPN